MLHGNYEKGSSHKSDDIFKLSSGIGFEKNGIQLYRTCQSNTCSYKTV